MPRNSTVYGVGGYTPGAPGGNVVSDSSSPDPPSDTIRDRAVAALDANASFLALASPTNGQVLTQVQRLTREATGLIRLVLDRTDDPTGT